MKIIYTTKFAREYKKLSKEIKIEAEIAERYFRKDPFDSRLKTHKLSGKLKNFWSFSISRSYRIIFEFGDTDIVYFHLIGDHSIYQ